MSHPSHKFAEDREIFVRLEQYDDIFSDFDIRPYSKRALSSDFLGEIKRASLDKREGGIELVLYVPKGERSESQEATIRERLGSHFRKHYEILRKERRNVLAMGFSMVALGVVCMIAATVIHSEEPSGNLFLSFALVFLEPAAWFLLWEGMDQIIFSSRELNPELGFYRKMSDSRGNIHFKAVADGAAS